MKLQVKNLGSIKQGAIDLDRRFYVFVGYNNSGKTYISQLIWSLKNRNFTLWDLLGDDVCNDIISTVADGFESEKTYSFNFDKRAFHNRMIERFNQDIKNRIDFQLDCQLDYPLTKSYERTGKAGYKKNIFLELNESSIKITFDKGASHIANLEDFPSFLELEKPIKSLFLGKDTTFFLPANRAFFPTFYNHVSMFERGQAEELRNKINAGESIEQLRQYTNPYYTAQTGELLKAIEQLNINSNSYNGEKYYQDLLDDLQQLIGGDITEKNGAHGFGNKRFGLKTNKGQELDMYMASSSVNQLTSLYLYFKYFAKESHNFLIIDEPEVNLHPNNQVKLLDILMKFSERNHNKVLITTHSSIVTDAVNNHYHLATLVEKIGIEETNEILKNKKIDVAQVSTETLLPKDYGVYFFNGSSINEYTGSNYGIFFRDFHEAQRNLKDTASLLQSEIYDITHSTIEK